MQAHSLWFSDKGKAELQKEDLSPLKSGYCHIRTINSSISLGTESLVFKGKVPQSLFEEMRCPYMEGSFAFPLKYGYSLVGEVVDGPAEIQGKLVHLLHPHQDQCQVRVSDISLIPSFIPPARATLASNMETAVNAIWDSQLAMGEKILVVGFGLIGALIAQLASFHPGIQVDICEVDYQQSLLAQKLGFSIINKEEISNDYDLAFHTSGNGEGLQTALDSLGFEGRVIELSWYGTQSLSIQLGTSFHSMRKKIICSQVSHVATSQRARWNYKRRKDLVFSLLKNPVFDSFITDQSFFSDLPQVFEEKLENLSARLAYLVSYERNS